MWRIRPSRRQGLSPIGRRSLDAGPGDGNRMRETGKRGVLTFVDYGNWPSLRTHMRFGLEPAETVLALNVLGVKMFRTVKTLSAARTFCCAA